MSDTDPRTPRARWRRPRAKREPRAAARHRVSPLSSSPPSAAGTTAPPPTAGSRARSQQNSGRRALPYFRSQHGALAIPVSQSEARPPPPPRAHPGAGLCEDTPPVATLCSSLLLRPSLSFWASPIFRKGEPQRSGGVGGGKKRGESRRGERVGAFEQPWVRAGRKLLGDVANSGTRPDEQGDGRGSGGTVRCQGPGERVWGVFSS